MISYIQDDSMSACANWRQNVGAESAFMGSVPRLKPAVHSRLTRFVCDWFITVSNNYEQFASQVAWASSAAKRNGQPFYQMPGCLGEQQALACDQPPSVGD